MRITKMYKSDFGHVPPPPLNTCTKTNSQDVKGCRGGSANEVHVQIYMTERQMLKENISLSDET